MAAGGMTHQQAQAAGRHCDGRVLEKACGCTEERHSPVKQHALSVTSPNDDTQGGGGCAQVLSHGVQEEEQAGKVKKARGVGGEPDNPVHLHETTLLATLDVGSAVRWRRRLGGRRAHHRAPQNRNRQRVGQPQ